MEKIKVEVNVSEQSYEIFIGFDVMDKIAEKISNSGYGNRYAIITDTNVKELYGDSFLRNLKSLGLNVEMFTFSAGEKNKTRKTKNWLDDQLLNNNFARDGVVIALGGGVVGDMAGFVAATYMRGIPCIQIPTTVISQGDSSIGGKTAIDVPQGKNLIGAFYHPKKVLIDINTLNTLDERNYKSGLIEIIKHGMIQDISFFEFIEKNISIITSRDSKRYPEIMKELIKRNCKIKNEVVSLDEKEENLRKILNYGHTVGHSIEYLSDYSLLHGEAISIGIVCEAYFSYKLGYSSKDTFKRQLGIIKNLGLPYKIPDYMKVDEIVEKMYFDKKVRLGEPEFVLLKELGEVKVFENKSRTIQIDKKELISLLNELRSYSF